MMPNVLVSIVLLTALLLVGLYDAIAMMFYGTSYTVSYVVRNWSSSFPIISLLVGLVIGHLFWPVSEEDHTTPSDTLHNGRRPPAMQRGEQGQWVDSPGP